MAEPTWWKESADLCKLSSDLHTCSSAHVPLPQHVNAIEKFPLPLRVEVRATVKALGWERPGKGLGPRCSWGAANGDAGDGAGGGGSRWRQSPEFKPTPGVSGYIHVPVCSDQPVLPQEKGLLLVQKLRPGNLNYQGGLTPPNLFLLWPHSSPTESQLYPLPHLGQAPCLCFPIFPMKTMLALT